MSLGFHAAGSSKPCGASYKGSTELIGLATKHNSYNSLFFRLPGEVRNKIYIYFFSQQTYTFVSRNTRNRTTKNSNKKTHKPRLILQPAKHSETPNRDAFVQTCRQVRLEAKGLPMLYSTCQFSSLLAYTRMKAHFSLKTRMSITKLHLQLQRTDKDDILSAFITRTVKPKFAVLLPEVRHVLVDIFVHQRAPIGSLSGIFITIEVRMELMEDFFTAAGNVELVIRLLDANGKVIEPDTYHNYWLT